MDPAKGTGIQGELHDGSPEVLFDNLRQLDVEFRVQNELVYSMTLHAVLIFRIMLGRKWVDHQINAREVDT